MLRAITAPASVIPARAAQAAPLDYPRQQLIGHTQLVDKVAFSPDGRYVLTGSGDGTAWIWDADYHATISYLICGR